MRIGSTRDASLVAVPLKTKPNSVRHGRLCLEHKRNLNARFGRALIQMLPWCLVCSATKVSHCTPSTIKPRDSWSSRGLSQLRVQRHKTVAIVLRHVRITFDHERLRTSCVHALTLQLELEIRFQGGCVEHLLEPNCMIRNSGHHWMRL